MPPPYPTQTHIKLFTNISLYKSKGLMEFHTLRLETKNAINRIRLCPFRNVPPRPQVTSQISETRHFICRNTRPTPKRSTVQNSEGISLSRQHLLNISGTAHISHDPSDRICPDFEFSDYKQFLSSRTFVKSK